EIYQNVLQGLKLALKYEIRKTNQTSSVSQIRDRLKSECERLKTLATDAIKRLEKANRSTNKLKVLLESVQEQETKLDRVGQSDSDADRAVVQVVEIMLKRLATEIEKEAQNSN